MAKLNLDYYKPSDDKVYSDGDIENELLEYALNNECDWYSDGRWPIVYHMSHLRHNILNWYPFKSGSSVLEIGAGCGALTGLLCERAAKVVSVELTKRRAEVNYQRHKHCENLEIVVCDFQKIPSEWKFDYVIINGVLEYAAYMIESENPYEDFLRISAGHLHPKGRILLAIENRLGLKYFSGAKEDHTGKYFSGINGYVDGEKVRTFSKDELVILINKAQLCSLKFYYPFPDYKFPAEIFTDKTICEMFPSVSSYPIDMSRTKLFEENAVYQSLMQSGVMDRFSNSFLVEIAASSDVAPAEITYVKISANRNERFQIFTYFDENPENVYKEALHPLGEEHLINMAQYSDFRYTNDRLKNIVSKKEEKGLSFPFIKSDTLEEVLLAACERADLIGFQRLIHQFREVLFAEIPLEKQLQSKEFLDTFGTECCEQELRWTHEANVDMISGNIFLIEDGYRVIDYEWHIPCKVPQEFVMWRMLKQFVDDHSMNDFITKPLMYSLIDIKKETEACFFKWEAHFAEKYVGIKDLFSIAKDIIPVDIEQAAIQQMKERVLQSTLFYDLGNGFSDEYYERSNAAYSSTGFTVTFSDKHMNMAKLLRWDPLEGNASCIQIHEIQTDGTGFEIKPINAERFIEKVGYEFYTYDPQFQITGDFSSATYLRIHFSCSIMDWTQGYQKREAELISYSQKLEEQVLHNQYIHDEMYRTQAELDVKVKENNTLQTENITLQTENNALLTELTCTKDTLEQKQYDLQNVQGELRTTQNDLHHIITQMNKHRIKSMIKVLMFGSITRGKSGE